MIRPVAVRSSAVRTSIMTVVASLALCGDAFAEESFLVPATPAPTGLRPAPGPTDVPVFARPAEAAWYTRLDYFHWTERLDGAEFCREDGLLVSVGYARRTGIERFRVEAFGGSVDYSAQFRADDLDPGQRLSGMTDYVGVRGEAEVLWEPDWSPGLTWFAGLGARFWVRSLADVPLRDGTWLTGYHETWWTLYPYLGVETRRDRDAPLEWFASGRIGVTAFTYEYISIDDLGLHPRPGLTGQIETGLRGRHFLLSAFVEAMSWEQSNHVAAHPDYFGQPAGYNVFQPASILFTAGLRAGLSY